jgi:hypothetical protein
MSGESLSSIRWVFPLPADMSAKKVLVISSHQVPLQDWDHELNAAAILAAGAKRTLTPEHAHARDMRCDSLSVAACSSFRASLMRRFRSGSTVFRDAPATAVSWFVAAP